MHGLRGVSRNYTVVVWIGRADGGVRPGATGRKTAAPLLFRLFDMLARGDAVGGASDREQERDPLIAQSSQASRSAPPEILFPRNGAELFADDGSRGFALAARGGLQSYKWYVNGEPAPIESTRRARGLEAISAWLL